MPKSSAIGKKSQKKSNGSWHSLTHHHKRRQRSNYLQYHGIEGPKRDMEQTQMHLQQNRPRSRILYSSKTPQLPED